MFVEPRSRPKIVQPITINVYARGANGSDYEEYGEATDQYLLMVEIDLRNPVEGGADPCPSLARRGRIVGGFEPNQQRGSTGGDRCNKAIPRPSPIK